MEPVLRAVRKVRAGASRAGEGADGDVVLVGDSGDSLLSPEPSSRTRTLDLAHGQGPPVSLYLRSWEARRPMSGSLLRWGCLRPSAATFPALGYAPAYYSGLDGVQ